MFSPLSNFCVFPDLPDRLSLWRLRTTTSENRISVALGRSGHTADELWLIPGQFLGNPGKCRHGHFSTDIGWGARLGSPGAAALPRK
jgi:hypothetical protein